MRRNSSSLRFVLTLAVLCGLFFGAAGRSLAREEMRIALGDSVPQSLPFSQNWSNNGLISANDDWSGVLGVVGYLGNGLALVDADPQTVLGSNSTVDVIANQTNPNALAAGGVAEFELTDSVVALQGSGTADAPNIVFFVSTIGKSNITISYNLRDIDGSTDDAVQKVALQYRVGSSGNFTNVLAGYVADATQPNSATLVTPVTVVLPSAVNNKPEIQIRIITVNAAGNDEWVGIDDISITGTDMAPSILSTAPAKNAINVPVNSYITINFSEDVNVSSGWYNIVCGISGAHTITVTPSGPSSSYILDPDVDFDNDETCVVFIDGSKVTDVDSDEPPDMMASNYSFSFQTASLACTPTINASVRAVIINEVAWMGTQAFAGDEWIELYNPGAAPICLTNWRLEAADGTPSISLSGMINPGEFLVLERDDDNVITDVSGQIYKSGLLSDSGETLRLLDPNRKVIDTANDNGGPWPAGTLTSPINNHGTMERRNADPDTDANWFTSVDSTSWKKHDAAGNFIHGTPGEANSTPPTPTDPPPPTLIPTPVPSKSVIISEVAWMGTAASPNDEWIELYNTTRDEINLEGWHLVSFRWSGTQFYKNLDIALKGVISPRTSTLQNDTSGYFLLVANENAVSFPGTSETYDQKYTGSLYNTGEILLLCSTYNIQVAKNCDENHKTLLVDFVNARSRTGTIRPWPAGSSSIYGSMERQDWRSDDVTAYFTHTGANPHFGFDANGNFIKGTPKYPNWAFTVTSTPRPTALPTRTATPKPGSPPVLVLNEVMARAGTDWNADGRVDVYDEFIEVINAGTSNLSLSSYKLSLASAPAAVFSLPSQTLKPGERMVFYGSQSGLQLKDSGDTVRLLRASNNSLVDAVAYPIAKVLDASVCRYADGYGSWIVGCYPTPGLANALTGGRFPLPVGGQPVCHLPDSTPRGFVLAECEETGGSGMWNPAYWDSFPGEGQEVWISDPHNKWLAVYQ